MSLSARSIAMQGLGFGSLHIALQGLVGAASPPSGLDPSTMGYAPRHRGKPSAEGEEIITLVLGLIASGVLDE